MHTGEMRKTEDGQDMNASRGRLGRAQEILHIEDETCWAGNGGEERRRLSAKDR